MVVKSPIPTEHQEQARLVKILRSVKVDGRKLLFCAVPNGAHTSIQQAMKLKREGLERHVPDLLIFTRSPKTGLPLAIEMKRTRGSRIDPGQQEYLDELRLQGWHTAICCGFEQAAKVLRTLGYLLT